ncbi:MAG TPA: transporter substrate-binding domain-containing protein [Bacteroidales bacterium]|nr:transporter substrate-binding domain-containing protein [Bacteroidales bacterium]
MFVRILLLYLIITLSACGRIPADPEKSFEKAKGTGLAAGFSQNPPWVIEDDGIPHGVEADLITGFAASNGMKVIWHKGSEQKLMEMLEKKELHLVINGLTKDNPWKSRRIGMTLPYFKAGKEKHVIAVQQGENRLLMHLQRYLEERKDSINGMINAYKQEF